MLSEAELRMYFLKIAVLQKSPKKSILEIVQKISMNELIFLVKFQTFTLQLLFKKSYYKLYSHIHKPATRVSRPEVFCKKVVLKNVAKFTGKHLSQSLFLTKLQAWGLELY